MDFFLPDNLSFFRTPAVTTYRYSAKPLFNARRDTIIIGKPCRVKRFVSKQVRVSVPQRAKASYYQSIHSSTRAVDSRATCNIVEYAAMIDDEFQLSAEHTQAFVAGDPTAFQRLCDVFSCQLVAYSHGVRQFSEL